MQLLVRGDAVDPGGRRQAILLPNAHHGSVVLKGEDANNAGSSIQGIQIAAVIAGGDIDIDTSRGSLANNAVNGSEFAITFDIEAGECRIVGIGCIHGTAKSADHIPAGGLAARGKSVRDDAEGSVPIKLIGRNR